MRRVSLLVTIFGVAVLLVAAVVIGLLYQAAIRQQTATLAQVVDSQARVMETIARNEKEKSAWLGSPPGLVDPYARTLQLLRDANSRFRGFGRTGEFTLARREGDSIVYLLSQRHTGATRTQSIPFKAINGEPMRRALSGRTGTVVAPDYRGVTVLAAYAPVEAFGMGVVAKVDLAEVRAPFVRAGLISIVAALIVVLLGSLLFYRTTNPVLRQLEESEIRLRDAQKLAHLGSWALDLVENKLTWSDEVYQIFGLRPQEFEATYEAFLAAVHPDDRAAVDAAYTNSVRDNRDGYEIEHRVVRKDTSEVRVVQERCEHSRDAAGRVIRSTGMVHDITEQRSAEESLRRSEGALRGILDATGESIWLFSTDGHVLQTNATALKRFGKTASEVVGKSMEEILSPELARSRLARLREVVESTRLVEFEDERAGIQFRHSFCPVLDAEGHVATVASFSRDITDGKRAEQALRESESKFRIVADNTYDFEFWLDPDGRYIYASPACERITGHKPEEFLVDSELRFRIVHPDDLPLFKIHRQEELARQTATQTEFRVVRPNGDIRWIGHVCRPVYDAEGRFLGTRGSNRDITERKQAEKALRESEERLRKLYASMSEGLVLHQVVYDGTGKATDYRILDVNPSFEAITGLSRDKAVGRLASELYGTGIAPYIDIYAKVAATSEPAEFETEFAPMAKCFHISVFSPGKGVFATVFSDITIRKQAERKLAEQASMLASANDAIIGYDAGYHVTFWNKSAELMYGYSQDEAMGKFSTELFHPVYVDVTREQMVERIAADGHIEAESIRTTRDGRQISVEAHVIALRDEQGRTTGFVSVDRDITERKRDEDALRRSTSFNQSIIDSSRDCIKILDMDGRLTYMSQAGQRLLGIKDITTYLNVPYEEFWQGSDREAVVDVISEARKGQSGSFQGYCPTADGVPKWWDVSISPVLGANGQPESLLAVSRDITERRKAEEELREAKETLEARVRERTAELVAEVDERRQAEKRLAAASQYARSLLEASLDPLVTINAEGRITDVNVATIKATGATRVELIGTDFSEYFTEPDKAREGYRQVFAEGAVTDYALTIRHRDGHLTDVLYNASLYRDADGKVVGVFAAARDVTERKRAEAAVAAERQRLHDVLNMLPAYVILLAPDHTVPFANRFFEERFGESLGRRCYSYLFHRSEPCENCESYKAMATGSPHHWEWKGPDGRDYDISDFPFRDVDGSPLIMEVGIDITERKQAEQALQRAHDQLEAKIAERTAELTRSNTDLEQFAYVASHDLQEPLRMVASYVELLAQRYRGRLDDKADRYIAYASGGAKRMHQLVNDLLAFSRVGTRTEPVADVSLDRVAAQALQNLAVAIERFDAVVTVGPMPEVRGDEGQLVQLFQNLLENAIKFHGKEPPRIRVNADPTGPSVASLPSVTIRVTDNGIGIDPRHAERIFGLFKRLHTEEEYPGTGIGLAVCKKIVERHGGTIRVEPAEGGGSVFLFTLPAVPAEEGFPPRPPV